MNETSRKTAEVAELPLKMNLQLFADEADGTPSLEDTPEFREDAKEFNAKMDKFVEERTKESDKKPPAEKTTENEPVEESKEAAKPEVAAPDEKPKQDSETNKAFQEMRQKLEAAEREKAENAEKARRADEAISRQWGHLGIHTVEQFEQREKEEQEAEDNKRYQEAGLTPEEVEKIRKYDELQKETEVKKQAEYNQYWEGQYAELTSTHADAKVSSWEDVQKLPNFDKILPKLERGYSLVDAYELVNKDIVQKNLKEAAKQEALNQINSKNHIKASGAEGGDVDHVEIDEDTMRMYRSLNKGKSDAEIRKWHKKNAM